MRFAPAAVAISLLAAVTGSAGLGAQDQPDPRSQALVAQGQMQLESGDVQGAIDSFEAALVVDPSYTDVYIRLAEAARKDGLQGKAIHYYREALERDPRNLAAISGEGEAMAEKGALEGARENLSRLENLCGAGCLEVAELAAAIERGPLARVVTAEATTGDASVSAN